MADLFDDPLDRLINEEERISNYERNIFRREFGCYKCVFSKVRENKSVCAWEVEGYPDRSSVEAHDNYCKEWRAK